MERETKRGGRVGGRSAKQASNSAPNARSEAYRQLRHPFAPQSIFSVEEADRIHDTALRVIEELGMKFCCRKRGKSYSRLALG